MTKLVPSFITIWHKLREKVKEEKERSDEYLWGCQSATGTREKLNRGERDKKGGRDIMELSGSG